MSAALAMEAPARNLSYRLAAMRAALSCGLVVRFSQAELDEVVEQARREGVMGTVGSRHVTAEIIRAFGLEALGAKPAGCGLLWLLIPPGAMPPTGELGGGAQIVACRWGRAGLPLFEPVGIFKTGDGEILEKPGDGEF